MRFLICSICFFVFSAPLFADSLEFSNYYINPDSTVLTEENINSYTIADSILDKLPFKNQNNLNRIYPGVVSYFQDFYIRGGESYETGFSIEGSKFNDLFSGKNSFFINPNAFEQIDFYNGLIPADLGNVSSGLFNYKLKSGGEKLEFKAEHLSDNMTFTSDPYSGKKRLGAYFYGYNETNISLSGPLYFDNIKFYTNINYLFQRDKNPQRYPGIDRQFDNGPYYPDTLQIFLPAGIVNFNSLENFTSVSTLDFDFDAIKIRAYGIYFDENTFAERNHVLQYLNPRAGLVDKNGGIFNVKFDHQLSEILSYSLNANYSFKNDITTDEFLGDDYWSYGDSVANANAGVVWNRTEQEIASNWYGRFQLPLERNISGWAFEGYGYPSIDHKISTQSVISFSGQVKFNFKNHNLSIGGNFDLLRYKYWYAYNQKSLAGYLDIYKNDSNYVSYSDDQIKEIILNRWAVGNVGYDILGNEDSSEDDRRPEPFFAAIFIQDNFQLNDDLIFDLGLRYDVFEFDQERMIDPSNPERSINFDTDDRIESGYVKTNLFNFVSPKVFVKYKALNNLSFFTSYSQNVQNQPYSASTSSLEASNTAISNYGGTLSPIITKQFQLGLEYCTINHLNVGLTYYNKRISNLISLEYTIINFQGNEFPYNYLDNKRTRNVNGIEINLDCYTNGLFLNTSFNYQNSTELVSLPTPENQTSIFINTTKELLDVEQSNKIFFNILLAYDFSSINSISSIFNGLNFSTYCKFNSGHPIRRIYKTNYSTFQAFPETTPSTNQIDIKIEKRFQFLSNLSLDFYIYVINLFDKNNIYDVFSTSGSVDNDGFDMINGLVQIYGEQARDLHRLLLSLIHI